MGSPITLYEWIQNQFAPGSPQACAAIDLIGPHLAGLVHEGDMVLDLCCGAGSWSFFLEEKGASVVGVDFAEYMIDRARDAAKRRGSGVEFVLEDVVQRGHGDGEFDLAVLLGNSISDLAPSDLRRLIEGVHLALRPGGWFALQYLDGILYLDRGRSEGDGLEQEEPVRITSAFKEYRPDEGAWVVEYRNEATGERYQYRTFVYPTGLLRRFLEPLFVLESSMRLSEASFFDVFARVDIC